MSVVVIPNVSAARDRALVQQLAETVRNNHARVLDIHSDPVHERSVLTVAGDTERLVDAMEALATRAAELIDLRVHRGVHPRFGVLDVCPFVPLGEEDPMDEATDAAVRTASRIATRAGMAVYLYGTAARSEERHELVDVRRAIARGDAPDLGPSPSARSGAVCVGARHVLIAFNVWLRCDIATARDIAAIIRERNGGMTGVRALGLEISTDRCQVSTNITRPADCGIDAVYEKVSILARNRGVEVEASEIVGAPPQRFLPDPSKEAARRLMSPGHSLETLLAL
jgi:glutamate formiminotransferase